MSASTSSLRWVLYDGIYYAAILVPASEAPVTVPEHSAFVFFLDGESGAVVSESDVLPYDPTDKAKAEHPAAVEGVRLAHGILHGTSGMTEEQEAVPYRDGESFRDPDEWELQQLMGAHLDEEDDVDEDAAAERAERRRIAKEEKLRRKEERAAQKAEKKKKKRERGGISGSDEDEDEDEASTIRKVRSSASASVQKKGITDQSHWAELADMLEDDEDDGHNRDGGLLSGGLHGRRIVHASDRRGRDALAGGLAALMDTGSPVAAYLAEIHHHYHALQEEARERGMVLSASEQMVVSSIDAIVQRNLATAQYLERELEKLEQQQYEHADANGASAEQKKSKRQASSAALEKERVAVEAVVERLSGSPNIEMLVKQLAQMLPGMDSERPDGQPRRRLPPPGSSTSTFMDPGFAQHLREVASSAATPLPMTADLAATLREQRVYRERVMSYRKGLGKAGLNAPTITPMASWNRARELMVLAPAVETQPVRPVGYVPRRYSALGTQREALALRRLSVGLPADDARLRGSASPTMAGSMGPPALASQSGGSALAQNSFLSSQQDLLSTYMRSTRQARLTVPAYYDFHALRPSPSGGAGSGMRQAQNGLSAVSGASDGANGLMMAGPGEENHLVFRSTADAGLFMSQLDDETGDMGSVVPHEVPQLAVNFDPRAAFMLGTEEIQEEHLRAAQLAGRSQMYSNSVYLPSEESQWFDSVAYPGGGAKTGDERSAVSRQRSRSRASSIGRDSEAASKSRPQDWREKAKRTILERLTLYVKGLRGLPKVLDEATFKVVAKKLLERAVQAESLRSGTSMVLRVNNDGVAFTKQTERQLKASVDKYVKRHFIDQERPLAQSDATATAESHRGSPHSEENSPVYDE